MQAHPKTVHQAQAWPEKMTHQGSAVHVEVVCQLSNHERRPDSYVELELDAEDYYKIKDGDML